VNTPTLVASLIMAVLLVLLIAFIIRQMMRGWLHRAQRQAEMIGALPPLPDTVGPAIIAATKGLYVGSTIAGGSSTSWLERIAVGDLGFRSKATLTRYPEGIMLQRSGAGPIWIPDESITAIRTERGIAGKALTHDGILAIRWRLPSGTEIDTGFRGDDRRELANWVEEDAA
jgi:hypothetical protein